MIDPVELAELRKDRERLDWLGDGTPWPFALPCKDLRKSIDDAMSQEPIEKE